MELKNPVQYKNWTIRIEREFSKMYGIYVYMYKTDPANIEAGTLLYYTFAYPWLPIPYGAVNSKMEAITYAKKMIDSR